MRENRKIFWIIPGVSLIAWLVIMTAIYRIHYRDNAEKELGFYSSDISLEQGERNYYNIQHGDQKIGYKSELVSSAYGHKIIREDISLKLSIAGKSREIFTQTSVTIDTLQNSMTYMDYVLHSGSHTYYCNGRVHQDSLIIQVKKNINDPLRTGYFPVHGNVTVPFALPYIIENSPDAVFEIQIFDPFSFNIKSARISYLCSDSLIVENAIVPVSIFDIDTNGSSSRLKLDLQGNMIEYEGALFPAGIFHETQVRKTADRDVFLLPLESGIGDQFIDSIKISTDTTIPNPRELRYIEAEIQGIRAANIDIDAPNKKVLSVNPVVFGISKQEYPLHTTYSPQTNFPDTTVFASTDYIESQDGRILRAADNILDNQDDHFQMAIAINQWIYHSLEKEPSLHIVRSVDILKDLRGGADEYTKLFAALARSKGIPVYINMGFVHDGDGFIYHSWPSIFYNDTWYDMDPYYGQDIADATHIALIRGSFEQKIELLRLIGDIDISILKWQ